MMFDTTFNKFITYIIMAVSFIEYPKKANVLS